MHNKIFFLLIIFYLFIPKTVFARDPYPNRGERTKYIVAPNTAQAPYDGTVTDPQTMMRTNGKRADIISFSCFDPTSTETVLKAEGRQRYIYLTDPSVDSLQKANALCAPKNPPYTIVKPPYLKNNKTTPECQGKEYDSNCYDWPIGNYLSPHPKGGKGGMTWVTPLVYLAQGGPVNACGPSRNERCDCIYVPQGPRETWIQITRTVNGNTERCVAPPYSTSGPWWDWFIGQMVSIQNSLNMNEISTAGVFLGIDGEGRPFKSDEGWGPDPGFNTNYVPKVIAEVKSRYKGKSIRAHFNRDLDFFLANELDFHWESLSSDGAAEYLYRGLAPMGYDQIYQNHFFKTNSLGLNPDWPPFYQDVLNALSKHTDAITGFVDVLDSIYQDGKGDFIKFAGSYIGKDINDTPGVWDNPRDTQWRKENQGNSQSGKYGDYLFYLYRMEDLEGNKTEAVSTANLPSGTSAQLYNYKLPLIRYGYPDNNQLVARKNVSGNNYMSFDIDDGYRYAGKTGYSFDINITYLDTGFETFKFQYKNSGNQWKEVPITKTDTKLWQVKKFTVNDAYFNNNASEGSNANKYPTDFRIETNGATIHLVEVIGKGNITVGERPKAQVSCDIVRQESDDPKEGIYSVGPNQNIKVKARLTNPAGNPLPNERIMFTYNSEWNFAASAYTNSSGVAFYDLSTANNTNRSGFVGEGGRTDLPSWYSVQVYYPGNDKFQPSRNDCLLLMTNSQGTSDGENTRIKITNIDTSSVTQTGIVKVTYQVINMQGGIIETKTENIGKNKNFFSDDPNAQTIQLSWVSRDKGHASFNNFTLNGAPQQALFSPPISLAKGINNITLPKPAYAVNTSVLPQNCPKLSTRTNYFLKPSIKNYSSQNLTEGKKYFISCYQNSTL